MRIALPWFVGLLVLTGGVRQAQAEERAGDSGQCGNLYTDDEAKALGEVIKKAAPRRQEVYDEIQRNNREALTENHPQLPRVLGKPQAPAMAKTASAKTGQ